MQTHMCPQGMMMALDSSDRQMVHSFDAFCSSAAYPLISTVSLSLFIFSGACSPNMLLISNGSPLIYKINLN